MQTHVEAMSTGVNVLEQAIDALPYSGLHSKASGDTHRRPFLRSPVRLIDDYVREFERNPHGVESALLTP